MCGGKWGGIGRVASVALAFMIAVLPTLAAPALPSAGPPFGRTAGADPVVVVETPSAGQSVSGKVRLVGWAADPAAPSGTGVDRVTVWLGGGPETGGTLLGEAQYGLPRADVAANLGGDRFLPCGFAFEWDTSSLVEAPQPQALVVAAHTGRDVALADLTVTVAPAPPPVQAAAVPQGGPEVAVPVEIAGVAFDAFRTPQSTFYIHSGIGRATVDRVVALVKSVATQTPKLTGGELETAPIDIYLFFNPAQLKADGSRLLGDPSGKTIPDNTGWLTAAFETGNQGLLLAVPATEDPWGWSRIIAGAYLDAAAGGTPQQTATAAVWLRYGTIEYIARAMYLAESPDDEQQILATRYVSLGGAYGQKRLIPLDQLVTQSGWREFQSGNAKNATLARAEATVAVAQLANKQGISRVARVLRQSAGGAPWATAFEEALGQSPAAFQRSLFSDVPSLFPAVLPERGPKDGLFHLIFIGFDPNEAVRYSGVGPAGSATIGPAATRADDSGVVHLTVTAAGQLGILPGAYRVSVTGGSSGTQATAQFLME